MKNWQQQKGFTLVELAIVLTIIGLLIGGILKGQQLMQNARVTATIAQVNAIESATTTFRDTYNATPGDMLGAQNRIAGYANTSAMASLGDGVVGQPAWNLGIASQATAAIAAAAATIDNETVLYWAQLSKAGLLSGITYDGGALAAGAAAFGATNPSARVGGGWQVGNSNGAQARIGGGPAVTVAGTVLVLASTLANIANPPPVGTAGLLPTTAAQMDRKMDDGMPSSGFTQAYGFTPSAIPAPPAPAGTGCMDTSVPPIYKEANTGKDCGLIFRIQQ